MATKPKTQPTDKKVSEFLATVDDEQKRADAEKLCGIMEEIVEEPATMWGSSIIGFGSYHYAYASGREADWMLAGFSPRKKALTLYIMSGFEEYDEENVMDGFRKRLGKHSTGKSCLYIKKLEDIDLEVLQEMIRKSVEIMRERYPE